MSTNQLQLKPTFEDAMKAEEKIVFLVEYLKSDQFYPEYCTEVGQEGFKSYLNPLHQEWKN